MCLWVGKLATHYTITAGKTGAKDQESVEALVTGIAEARESYRLIVDHAKRLGLSGTGMKKPVSVKLEPGTASNAI